MLINIYSETQNKNIPFQCVRRPGFYFYEAGARERASDPLAGDDNDHLTTRDFSLIPNQIALSNAESDEKETPIKRLRETRRTTIAPRMG